LSILQISSAFITLNSFFVQNTKLPCDCIVLFLVLFKQNCEHRCSVGYTLRRSGFYTGPCSLKNGRS